MPWNSGVFSRTNGVNTGPTLWASDAAQGFNIITSHHDTNDQDIATGLNNCVTVDGLNQISANFLPKLDSAYNIGSSAQRFQNENLAGALNLYNGSNAVSLMAGTLTAARAVNFGDFAGVVVIDTATQTLTNKTLTAPTINAASLTGVLAVSSGAVNEAFATIASASTVAIGAASANYLQVTGTTTITAFDTIQAGTERQLEFAGILTLTNNATSLILPGGANITTAAGDTALFRSEGSGHWRCVSYNPASGTAVVVAAAGVTSIADATNGGLNFSASTGAVTANLKPSDLVTKAAPTTSDSVMIMDAANSNVATTATLAHLMQTLAPAIVQVQDRRASGTSGDTPAASTWNVRTLQTKNIDTASIATLSGNQITLPAGTYEVDIEATGGGPQVDQFRLFDVTNSVVKTDVGGQTIQTIGYNNASGTNSSTHMTTRITLAGTVALRLDWWTNGTNAPLAITASANEVYSILTFRKIY